jgi:uncharacterized protein (DUF488 family)
VAQLLTVGHGRADRDELVALLGVAGIDAVVDVRRFPGSRRNPDVASEAMAAWLPAAGIDYRWDERFGGRRRTPNDDADRWWQVEAFRAYAAHMRSGEFRAAMRELVPELASQRTAVMCSESLWWRCHRRLISDATVLLHDVEVLHLHHDGRLVPHRPAEGARVTSEGLAYPLGEA